MFDETIKTFLEVAKCGSFSKTAEGMYLAPNAIKKRINRLESQIGLTLFIRSNKGVALTEAGASLLKDVSVIHTQYLEALEKARRIQTKETHAITIGMTTTFSDTFTLSNWHEIRKKLSNNPIHIAYYGNTLADCEELLRDVGRKIDVCIDIYDEKTAKKYGLYAKKISDFPLYLGIPDDACIVGKKTVSFEDIKGERLAILEYGRALVFDKIHELIAKEYPEIGIEPVQEYSIRSFNDNYMKKNYFLVTQAQIDLYPFYSFFPLNFSDTISFGIYYGKTASSDALNFVKTIAMIKD